MYLLGGLIGFVLLVGFVSRQTYLDYMDKKQHEQRWDRIFQALGVGGVDNDPQDMIK